MKYYDFDINTGEITITGLDLLKTMEDSQTSINPFLIKKGRRKKNVQSDTKRKVQREKDRSKYSCKGDVSSEVYWIYTE